jgi:hypothetical protein
MRGNPFTIHKTFLTTPARFAGFYGVDHISPARFASIRPNHIRTVITAQLPGPKITAKYQNTFRSPAVLLYREGTKCGAGSFGRDGSETSDGHGSCDADS